MCAGYSCKRGFNIFFMTDISTDASHYCLLNIKKYDDKRKDTKQIIFVDPGVMELKKMDEYKYVEKLHWLANNNLKSNEYISIDYPCDMVDIHKPKEEYERLCNLFLQRSIDNNFKYKDNPQYICTVQSLFMDYKDFEFRMKELEPIYAYKKKIVGLGNLCRLMLNSRRSGFAAEKSYFQKVIDYLIRNKEKFYWVHIYGMSKLAMKAFIPLLQDYAPNIILSVDNTKWTQGCNDKLRAKYIRNPKQTQLTPTKHKQSGISCSKDTRNEFFLEYMNDLKYANIKLKN
jgi:hypothetical protein